MSTAIVIIDGEVEHYDSADAARRRADEVRGEGRDCLLAVQGEMPGFYTLQREVVDA